MSHKSFDYLLQKYQLKCENRFIIYTKDLKYQDGIMYIPIYMTMYTSIYWMMKLIRYVIKVI